MTINFPAGVEGETHVENDVTYTFTNSRWVAQMAAQLWQPSEARLSSSPSHRACALGKSPRT